MGMFDYVRNSYAPLGRDFRDAVCQTKDLDNSMTNYWISPAGELFRIDISGTYEWIPPIDNDPNIWNPGEWFTNGEHGKVHPVFHLGVVRIYPQTNPRDTWGDWTEAHLHFIYGKLKRFELTTFGQYRIW